MCKVFMVAGIKSEHLPKMQAMAKIAAKAMSRVEDDGVGYAAITQDCEVYGEKWLNKDDAFVIHNQPPVDKAVRFMDTLFGSMAEWEKSPATGKVYESFGPIGPKVVANTVAFILHARKATVGDKTVNNVHPFFYPEDEDGTPATALIHNGSIANHAKLTKTMSTCDSEVILHEYLANSMYHNPWGVDNLSKTLVGEYAVGVLSSMWDGNIKIPFLDVFKSNKELYACFVPELETTAFCTSNYVLEEVLKEAGLTHKNMIKVKDGYLLRINAVTGERMDDLISFTTSSKHDTGWNKGHENSAAAARAKEVGPTCVLGPGLVTSEEEITATGEDDAISKAKVFFERKHPSLFTVPYIEVKGNVTAEEKDLFDQLEKDNKTDHKALYLVSVALAAQA